MRETIIILLSTTLLLAGSAVAQDETEPTVNESDYDTTVPEEDESYLNESEEEIATEPTVTDSDFDTTVPTNDDAYLDEPLPGADAPTGQASGGDGGARETPGPAVGIGLAALGLVALARGRR